MLAWGGFAATYTLAGRVLRSIGRRGALDPAAPATAGTLDAYRDDGPLALALGRIAPRALPASALVLAALALVLAVLIVTGDGASWWLAGGTLVVAVLLAGASAGRPLRDRMRWTVPPALRVIEYAGILWVAALAGPSSVPAAFALLAAITFRHYDIVYRIRQRSSDAAALAQPRGRRLGRAAALRLRPRGRRGRPGGLLRRGDRARGRVRRRGGRTAG